MHETLISYINSYASSPLSDKEKGLISDAFIPQKLKRKQFFLREGEVCKYSGFIVKGAMRQYSVDEKGVEHTVRLFIENWWANDRESFVMLTPSIYNIDSWEDTELLTITYAGILSLMDLIPAMGELTRKLDEKNYIATQKRLNAAISFPAEEQYKELIKNYPAFIERFPQHMIASYLGITPETLSRIRRQSVKR